MSDASKPTLWQWITEKPGRSVLVSHHLKHAMTGTPRVSVTVSFMTPAGPASCAASFDAELLWKAEVETIMELAWLQLHREISRGVSDEANQANHQETDNGQDAEGEGGEG